MTASNEARELAEKLLRLCEMTDDDAVLNTTNISLPLDAYLTHLFPSAPTIARALLDAYARVEELKLWAIEEIKILNPKNIISGEVDSGRFWALKDVLKQLTPPSPNAGQDNGEGK